ncbi:hypothetical protein HZH68_011567 [Vespula germanica]|uniref:Uncharacterized protein n=1 Tax=Vespula germanica TaxID=30212 RepID=A0A834JS92_VESGE|nr:hypothetical protein HZH68_011567 [Vespula germanica]
MSLHYAHVGRAMDRVDFNGHDNAKFEPISMPVTQLASEIVRWMTKPRLGGHLQSSITENKIASSGKAGSAMKDAASALDRGDT